MDSEEIAELYRLYYSKDDKEYPPIIKNKKEMKEGHSTGRCGVCGSNNLWEDLKSYGCDSCGKVFYI